MIHALVSVLRATAILVLIQTSAALATESPVDAIAPPHFGVFASDLLYPDSRPGATGLAIGGVIVVIPRVTGSIQEEVTDHIGISPASDYA